VSLWLAAAAWGIEACVGWPDRLYRRISHPVVWIGALIAALDARWNRSGDSATRRVLLGAACTVTVVGVCTAIAWAITRLLPDTLPGVAIEALLASALIASRSLYTHVKAVADPLVAGDTPAARRAVAMIVGRDPDALDEAGVSRAALESLAENASDGVVAPVLFAALFGLPGIAAYKAINTLDSMIGHRTERHLLFGRVAARLDDVVNLVPARLTALLLVLAGGTAVSPSPLRSDARAHRSPNAGWPEGAMAQALAVRLSGPRRYAGASADAVADTRAHAAAVADEPWLNASAADPLGTDVRRGLRLYVRTLALGGALLAVLAMLVHV